jgi:fatty-acid desaturase
MSLNTKVRLLQLVNYILSFVAVGYVFVTGQYYWLYITLISWFIIGHISTIITMHRLLTHRSFTTYAWLEKVLSVITVYSTVGPTISWVALHRMHHQHSDKEFDPHSPYINDKFDLKQTIKVFIGYDWNIPNIPIKYVKDLMREPIHRFIFDNYFKIIFVTLFILLLINPLLVLFLYSLPAALTVIVIGVVNTLGHGHGYRNYTTKDKSTNSWIASIISLGEGWHNNHHAKPSNYYIGEKWYEIDLMGLLIKLISTNK